MDHLKVLLRKAFALYSSPNKKTKMLQIIFFLKILTFLNLKILLRILDLLKGDRAKSPKDNLAQQLQQL